MKRLPALIAILIACVTQAALAARPGGVEGGGDPLPSWNDGETK